jgi:hypothetical protein
VPNAKAAPGKLLLAASDHTLIMIDFQSQMAFATKSIDPVMLRNNAALVANAAKIAGPTMQTEVHSPASTRRPLPIRTGRYAE